MQVIRVIDLLKKYDDFVAVNKISFQVQRGEIFGLLGPNGAGKSTTLEILETLQIKTSGQVFINDLDLDKQPGEIKKIIGVQLQSCGYYSNLNLVQLMDLFIGIYKATINPIELLKKVNLESKAKVLYKHLSGGQKQRFTIATALINNPEILFLDEPTTGLDPQARRNIWRLINEIKQKKITIILTTHYLDEAEQLCDRLAIMNQGKIVAMDTPENLIQQLLDTGFKKQIAVKQANLEDVFINLTGNNLMVND